MEWEDAIEHRVDGLAVIESIGDETEVTGRSSGVESEVGD